MDGLTSGPIDRTPGTPGSYKNEEEKQKEEEKEMLGAERRVPSSSMAAASPRNTGVL